MDQVSAIKKLSGLDRGGQLVFTTRDLAKIFFEDRPKAFQAGLARLVKNSILRRVVRLTIMTTGRKGEYKTPFGTLEFTHTKRSVGDILDSFVDRDRPLKIATKQAAIRDLKRVGRNLHLLDETL
ncbi:hypothetical protein M3P05_20060 [Sansalvadorimonas sp. 2012CJ34-2]|uniref:Uncharacterized protein n=1 Tax=Parendozoicomonas callyspongiae TaxID=2942213 RepID=A0ABT0PLG1_9GAMM|nr:hypothetical protein [Sansalvadorimonas sp. 2012CJ34-2]MCL6272220.1 hypothetical protein [Sansalvadorimonas sp. 2012CJ34-2]